MTDICKSMDKLTHSPEWVIGKKVTESELELLLHQVVGLKCWATWGNYIGYWGKTMVQQPDGLWKPRFDWAVGFLERYKCIKRSDDFKEGNETFVIINTRKYISPSMSREIIAELDKKLAELDKKDISPLRAQELIDSAEKDIAVLTKKMNLSEEQLKVLEG